MLNLVSLDKSLNCPDEPGFDTPTTQDLVSLFRNLKLAKRARFEAPKCWPWSPLLSLKTQDLFSSSETPTCLRDPGLKSPKLAERAQLHTPQTQDSVSA